MDNKEDGIKYYTSGHIHHEYNSLSPSHRIDTLWEALDYMQAYNGRSKILCIAMALGYDNNEGEDDTYFKRN